MSGRWNHGWRLGLLMVGALVGMAVAFVLALVVLLGLIGVYVIVEQTVSGFDDVETLKTGALALTVGVGAAAILGAAFYFLSWR